MDAKTKAFLVAKAGPNPKYGERIQSLWSGYGEIVRIETGAGPAILKHVAPPTASNHPRGWNTDRSHERKLRSYAVEKHFYDSFSRRCDEHCRVPANLGTGSHEGSWHFLLEDLDASGFPARAHHLNDEAVLRCLKWLAYFHARFMEESPEDLWPTGTYWHLDTRPDEWETMQHPELKAAASKIDQLLKDTPQTLVHGDAKVANFCFSSDFHSVAAVDFQYVGGGCGMKDVAYFLGSCLDEHACEVSETRYLDHYFQNLEEALQVYEKSCHFHLIEKEWRRLFPVAWTDFYRFLLGWMPTHAKINHYTKRLAGEVLRDLVS